MKLHWKQILTAFLIGCLAGGGAAFLCQRGHKFGRHGGDTDKRVRKFTRDLNLDAKQQEAVKAIFEGRRKQMETLRQESAVKFQEARVSINAEIEKLLNPEQVKKFEVLKTKWEEKRKKWERRF